MPSHTAVEREVPSMPEGTKAASNVENHEEGRRIDISACGGGGGGSRVSGAGACTPEAPGGDRKISLGVDAGGRRRDVGKGQFEIMGASAPYTEHKAVA